MNSILDRIQVNYPKLSNSEKRIADYVLNNYQTLVNIHIKELADNVGSSVATITRFCKKIDSQNFVEFKILLRDAVEKLTETNSFIDKVDQMYVSIIKSTNSLSDQSSYETACQWILKARSVHLYGVGSSGLTAQELKLRLTRMGIRVDTHTDSHLMIINSSILTDDDLVIAISNSGQTREVIDGVKLAKRKNAKVISITNFSETPLSNSSDLILFTSSLNSYEDKGLMNSQLSILYVLDIISSMLLTNQKAIEKRDKTLEALDEFNKI